MIKSHLLAAVCTCAFSIISMSSHAALLARDLDGNLTTAEAYYDNVAGLTWLADANYAQTSGYDTDGKMNWFDATTWAAGLDLDGTPGADGWRLPNTVDVGNDGETYTNIYQGVDFGYNITTHSEMSNMFYNVLGNTAFYDTSGTQTGCTSPDDCLTNTGPFSNLQSFNYWSSTEYAPITSSAWNFYFDAGDQGWRSKYGLDYAWAVQSGDFGAAIVPVPAAVWLFSSGLLGLVGIARKKQT